VDLAAEGEAEFRMLGVRPSHRGRGVGTALTRWCIDRARALGRTRLLLCTDRTMTDARRLYEGLGFRRRADLDWTPVPGVQLLAYELDLR
jgi:ribosomal protein S18 acetylase RimI-like enzyme